jgi:hypothetical protein
MESGAIMKFQRKTAPQWQLEVIAIMWLTTVFFSLCLALNLYAAKSKISQLELQVYASEDKEIAVAGQVSRFGKLLEATATPEPTPEPKTKPITLIVSWYNPALGGVNCAIFMNNECVSKMANGERWQDHMNEAIACPKELPFGTKIKVLDEVWTCRDRGGAIKKVGDKYWIDMLTTKARVPYGTVVQGEIVN